MSPLGNHNDGMDKEDAIWLAGVISIQGSFKNTSIVRKQRAGRSISYRLDLGTVKHVETIERASRITGIEVKLVRRNGGEVPTLGIWGDQLHEIMKQVWPWLTRERKEEYAVVKRTSDASVMEERPDTP